MPITTELNRTVGPRTAEDFTSTQSDGTVETILTFVVLAAIGLGILGLFKLWGVMKPKK